MAEFKIIMVDDERSQSPDLRGLPAFLRLSLVSARAAAPPHRIFATPPRSGDQRQSILSPRQSITNHRQGADAP